MTTQDDYKRALEVNQIITLEDHSFKIIGIHLGAEGQESLIEMESTTHKAGWTGEWEYHPRVFVPEIFVRQALQSKIGADGWMPIETAPRDGTEIDIWFSSDSGGYRIANCKYIDEQWYNYTLDEEFHEMDWMPVYDQQSALYWMPEYSPPAPRKEGE